MIRSAASGLALSVVLAACATSRIAVPAAGIEHSVARFRGELGNLQQAVGYLQRGEQDRVAYLEIQRQAAIKTVSYQQTLWAIEAGGTSAKIFSILRDQSRPFTASAGATSATGSTKAAPSLDLPLSKLDSVLQDLQSLSKPPARISDVKFMVSYVKSVKQDFGATATKSSSPQNDAAHP